MFKCNYYLLSFRNNAPCVHCLKQHMVFYISAPALYLSLCPLHVYGSYKRVWRKEIKIVCVAHLGFSTVYVTLCLRYSMYWFPRYNVSFSQRVCARQSQGQGNAADRDRRHGHLSNSDEEGGIARRRVPRRTSSEIASAKIAGRPIPGKVRRSRAQDQRNKKSSRF